MPKPPTASVRPRSLDEALEGAVAALRAGRPDDAEPLAAYVLKSNRGHLVAGKLLGQALLLQGRAKEAAAPLERAARTGDPEAEVLLARALSGAGREAEAEAALRRAMGRRPAFPLAFLELGDRLGRTGRQDEGAAVFEEGLALVPDAGVLRIGLGYIRLKQGQRAAAKALFAEVHAAAPGRYDAVLGLARVADACGDHAGAVQLYRQALDIRPEDTVVRISLATSLFELGERAQGEAVLRAATRGGREAAWNAINALSATPHGRAFLKPSAAMAFLRGERS
jgi:tetratricopeptide (TPR) repeat protein